MQISIFSREAFMLNDMFSKPLTSREYGVDISKNETIKLFTSEYFKNLPVRYNLLHTNERQSSKSAIW